jgi:hypothetical protein
MIPGGAPLASLDASVVDAGAWSRTEEERALREWHDVATSATTLGAYMQPVLRQRIVKSADALYKRNRWTDLAELTTGISPKSEFVPIDLFFLRVTALRRLHRTADAKELMYALVGSPVLKRSRDARAYATLAEQLASFDDYDGAIALYERSEQIRHEPYNDVRIAQLRMNKKLSTSYTVVETPHFQIHYPPDVHPITAAALRKVLEGELQRLQQWVAVPDFKPVVVNVVWWEDFRNIYTGSDDILGFYNGSITLPLAGLYQMNTVIVSIITHELTHAMLAQATNDQAPQDVRDARRRSGARQHARSRHDGRGVRDEPDVHPLSRG